MSFRDDCPAGRSQFLTESPHTAVSEHQWREYFGLPVMSLSAAANYYGLNVSEIEHHIRKKNTYAGGLFESGMLVLRDAALESARSWDTLLKYSRVCFAATASGFELVLVFTSCTRRGSDGECFLGLCVG
jgi:hypothetical protein